MADQQGLPRSFRAPVRDTTFSRPEKIKKGQGLVSGRGEMYHLVVEDLGPGGADPCPGLYIRPESDHDRGILRNSGPAAAGGHLGAACLTIAVTGKLPHIEKPGIRITGKI